MSHLLFDSPSCMWNKHLTEDGAISATLPFSLTTHNDLYVAV